MPRQKKVYGQKQRTVIFTLIYLGIILLTLMVISELNFHYVYGFKLENFENEATFWKAEIAQLFITIPLMIIGITLIYAGLYYRYKLKRVK